MINVLLVDDHKIIRDGIKAMLDDVQNEIKIVGECEDGNEVLPFLNENDTDIILMDINMRQQDGIETTELVLKQFPDIKIIALTMHNQESYITKMLKAGASGYILKNTGYDELVDSIASVYEGKNHFGKEVSEIMMSKFMKKPTQNYVSPAMASVEDLTTRELEIIKLISDELTNNEIAEKLFISPRTVDTHRRNLLQKLGVKNTAGLVKFAINNRLI